MRVYRGAGTRVCDSKLNRLWVRLPLEEMKELIFLFPPSGNESKRGVELCYLTRNASRTQRKEGNKSVLMGTERLNTRYTGSLYLVG